jgi:hypothetical protein
MREDPKATVDEMEAQRGLTDRRFSCEPQRFRGPSEAPKVQCQTLPEIDWRVLWLVSCNRLLDGGPGASNRGLQ